MSPLKAQLDEFIRRLGVDDERLRTINRRVVALRQGINDLYADGLTGGGRGLTYLHPQLFGWYHIERAFPNTAYGLWRTPAGVEFTFVDDETGTTYGPFVSCSADDVPMPGPGAATADYVEWPGSGFGCLLPPGGTNGNDYRTITVNVDPISPRFGSVSPLSMNVFPNGGHSLGGGSPSVIPRGTGYGDWNLSDLPLSTSLLLDDTARGLTAIPFTGHVGVPYYRWDYVEPVTGVFRYVAFGQGNDDAHFFYINYAQAGQESYARSAITSITLPTIASPSTKFSVTIAVTGGTVTIYEP